MPKKGKKKGVKSRKAGRHHPYVNNSYDIPQNGPPSIQDELDQVLDDDHGPPGESLPDPRVEGPDVSSSINLDSTDTGESVSTSAGDTTMVSGIDPQGNNETREQNIEPASEAQPEVQDSVQVNAEEQMDVSKEVEKSRPRWETISSDWSNRTIKDYRTSIKAFIISPYEGWVDRHRRRTSSLTQKRSWQDSGHVDRTVAPLPAKQHRHLTVDPRTTMASLSALQTVVENQEASNLNVRQEKVTSVPAVVQENLPEAASEPPLASTVNQVTGSHPPSQVLNGPLREVPPVETRIDSATVEETMQPRLGQPVSTPSVSAETTPAPEIESAPQRRSVLRKFQSCLPKPAPPLRLQHRLWSVNLDGPWASTPWPKYRSMVSDPLKWHFHQEPRRLNNVRCTSTQMRFHHLNVFGLQILVRQLKDRTCWEELRRIKLSSISPVAQQPSTSVCSGGGSYPQLLCGNPIWVTNLRTWHRTILVWILSRSIIRLSKTCVKPAIRRFHVG